jgi:hypothetical protein
MDDQMDTGRDTEKQPDYNFIYDKLQEFDSYRYCLDLEGEPQYFDVVAAEYPLDDSETNLIPASEDTEDEVLDVVYRIANDEVVKGKSGRGIVGGPLCL